MLHVTIYSYVVRSDDHATELDCCDRSVSELPSHKNKPADSTNTDNCCITSMSNHSHYIPLGVKRIKLRN